MEWFSLRAADAMVVMHFAFTVFVAAGPFLVLLGFIRGWTWTRNVWFRSIHLGSIAVVVAEAWLGAACPLTVWEHWLRARGGQPLEEGEFISRWTEQLLGFATPPWVLTIVYSLFCGFVIWMWWMIPPEGVDEGQAADGIHGIRGTPCKAADGIRGTPGKAADGIRGTAVKTARNHEPAPTDVRRDEASVTPPQPAKGRSAGVRG